MTETGVEIGVKTIARQSSGRPDDAPYVEGAIGPVRWVWRVHPATKDADVCSSFDRVGGSSGSTFPRIGETWTVLLIDAANVIGSRPTGWWRDRPEAARTFVQRVRTAVEAGRITEPVVVVLEGHARGGAEAGEANGVAVVHASGSGDDTLLEIVGDTAGQVTLVSADRALCRQAMDLGAGFERPGWLMHLLDQ